MVEESGAGPEIQTNLQIKVDGVHETSIKANEIQVHCEEVLRRLSDNVNGVVIGSGGNTEDWKSKNWKTMDIDPKFSADYVGDANKLSEILQPNSQDYLVAEGIPTSEINGLPGIKTKDLIQETSTVLKPGGYLIIKSNVKESGNMEGNVDIDEFMSIAKENGLLG